MTWLSFLKSPARPAPPDDDVGYARTYNQGAPQRQAYVGYGLYGRAKPHKGRIPERDRAWGFKPRPYPTGKGPPEVRNRASDPPGRRHLRKTLPVSVLPRVLFAPVPPTLPAA